MSLAGPLTNLVLGAGLILVVGIGRLPDGLAAGLSYLALMQVLAFVLNILSVPGLDRFGAGFAMLGGNPLARPSAFESSCSG